MSRTYVLVPKYRIKQLEEARKELIELIENGDRLSYFNIKASRATQIMWRIVNRKYDEIVK